jgi:hypothetical protein
MEMSLQELLENTVLGDETRTALQEAFSAKLKEAEKQLQESYAGRFEHEKAVLVETMDQMLNTVIRKELDEFQVDRDSVAAQKVRLAEATAKVQKQYNRKLQEHTQKLEQFMLKQIATELTEFRDDRKSLQEQRDRMAQELTESQATAKQDFESRVAKLENFVIKALSEEIAEFQADKEALVEQRVKLAREGKRKLEESRQKFVSRATQVVDNTLNEVIRKELVQWRDDIKVARENNFGRKIFEAVAAEYMSSYLSEGSATKKLQGEIHKLSQKLAEAHEQVQKHKVLLENQQRVTKVAQEQAERVKVLNELLSPLRGDKRAVMENLLTDVRTSSLKESFQRYLPTVIDSSTPVRAKTAPTTAPRKVEHSGDRVNLNESQTTTEENQDLQNILYLAGISARAQ